MGYAVMTKSNLNSIAKIQAAIDHNLREIPTANTDPALSDTNEELIVLEKNVKEIMEDKIQYRNSVTNRKLRNDAVLAFEFVTSISNEDAARIDLEKWKEENVKWFQEKFNVSPDGHDNVISITFHNDESRPHLHAVIVPMNEKGEIKSHDFIDGPYELRKLQTKYAKRMEKFGLKRGLERSVAKKVDIQHFYAKVNHAMLTVEQELQFKKGETIEQYHDRTVDFCKDLSGSYEKKIMDKEREIVELKTQIKNYERKHSLDEIVQANIEKKENEKNNKKFEGILREYKTIDNVDKKLNSAKRLNDAIVNCEDKEMQKDFMEKMHILLEKEDERRKKEKHLEREKEAREKLEK